MASKNQPGQLPTLAKAKSIQSRPVFLRKVRRPTPWIEAVENQEPSSLQDYLYESDGKVSLWHVQNDVDLLRAAIAANEGRSRFHEMIDFLPILPTELAEAGIISEQTAGETTCPTAARLHYDAQISLEDSRNIVLNLLKAQRSLLRCTTGEMKTAEQRALEDGCFAVSEQSESCKCGEVR
jgi:hypothetical protein